MAAAFGIHFGATTACLAVCRDGKADVVANDAGDRTTPAIVSYTNHDQTVGLAAKQGMIRNACNTVCGVKNTLGKKYGDPELESFINSKKGFAKIVNKDGSPAYQVEYMEKKITVSPVKIATIIYKKMMDTAESHGGIADSHNAVITVPLRFSEQQKLAAREAATKAGFCVLRILSEPAAAVLAYDLGQDNRDVTLNKNILVYKVGGTSIDVTIMSVSNGLYRVIASTWEKDVGGNKVDELLINHFAGEFKRQWKDDCTSNTRSVMKLRNAAENCKHILSRMQTTQCSVESLFEGIDFQSSLSRGRFEGLCNSFFQSCLTPLDDALRKATMEKDDIDVVILCGGTTKIPSLQQQLQDYFPKAELLSSIPPDEVLAVGASKQASILSGIDEAVLVKNAQQTSIPCLPIDVLVQTLEADPEYAVVLHRCTPVPAKRHQTFKLPQEQDSFKMHIFSRTGPKAEPKPLGKLTMGELPAGSEVAAVFQIKGDGSLIVSCTETSSNRAESITIQS